MKFHSLGNDNKALYELRKDVVEIQEWWRLMVL